MLIIKHEAQSIWNASLVGPTAHGTVRLLTKVTFTVQPFTRSKPNSEAELCIKGVVPGLSCNFCQPALRTQLQAEGGQVWAILSLLSLQHSFVCHWPGPCEWDWTLKCYSDLVENHISKSRAGSELDLPPVSMTLKGWMPSSRLPIGRDTALPAEQGCSEGIFLP